MTEFPQRIFKKDARTELLIEMISKPVRVLKWGDPLRAPGCH